MADTKRLTEIITGNDLQIARIIYGFKTQEALAEVLEVSLGTVQRYEALPEVDDKVMGLYERKLCFDIEEVIRQVARLNAVRKQNLTKGSIF